MNYFTIAKTTVKEWGSDKATVWAASLAYFTIFSLSPMLLLITAFAGIFLGEQASRGLLFEQIQGIVGAEAASLIERGVRNAANTSGNVIATTIGVVTLLFGATGVFTQLQQAFNSIWDVKTSPKAGIKALVLDRILSFSMLLIIAFLLTISVGVSFVISIAANYINTFLAFSLPTLQIVNNSVSFIILVLLFGAMFKVLPDIKISFKTVLPGAIVTALLFTIGKFLISWYVGNSAYTSTYGAAGSLMVLLIWIYLSVLILLLGAEFTKVYAKAAGYQVVPSRNAVSTERETKVVVKEKRLTGKEKAAAIGGYAVAGMVGKLLHNLFGKTSETKRHR